MLSLLILFNYSHDNLVKDIMPIDISYTVKMFLIYMGLFKSNIVDLFNLTTPEKVIFNGQDR